MTSSLDDNLAALARADAASLAWVREPARDGTLSIEGHDADVRLVTGDGRSLRLHSARDPRHEAEAQVAEALGDRGPSVVAVIGAGAGFVLEALDLRPGTRMLVVEPSRELALSWLARRSWREFIDAGRLRLLVGPAYTGSASASQFLGDAWTHLAVVVNPVLLREAPAEVARAREVLNRAAREALQNAEARGRFEDLAFRNTISNLGPLLREADAASLAGAFRGRPAVIVGAGPSLDANVEALRTLQSSCVVVAADTAVVPCLKGGVTPHLAVALDPSTDNARHLTRTLVPESIHLVCEASVDPSVPAAFVGRTFFFRVGRHAPWPWLEAAGVELGTLAAWGSVVTSALDLAVGAGCSPIVFAGLDLAFTGGRPYCRHTPLDDVWARHVAAGASFEDLWRMYLTARPIVRERGIDGDTPTAAHLVTFRDWLRDYAAARPEIRFLNGTGAGILHGPGVDVVRLEDLAFGPGSDAANIAGALARRRAAGRRPDRTAAVVARLAAASPLDLLAGHSSPHAAASHVRLDDLSLRLGAAASAAGDPAPPEAARVATPPAPSLWLPDAAVALRALDGERLGTFTDADSPNPAGARGFLREAFEAVRDARLAAARTRPGAADDEFGGEAWADVPAAAQVDWPPQVRPIIEAATAALHEALRYGWPVRLDGRPSAYFMTPPDPRAEGTVTGPLLGDPPPQSAVEAGLDALLCQWARVAAAVLGADAAVGRFINGLRAARPLLLPTPRAGTGLRAWLAPDAADVLDVADGLPVLPFLQDRAVMRAATGVLTLDPRSIPEPDAAWPTMRPFRLFALPAAWTPTGDRVPARQVPWSTLLEPDVLTDRGLGACRLATRLDDARALVTLLDGSGSYTVDENGTLLPSEAWPRRVDGEIVCGRRGRLAWSWDGARHLLFRPDAGAPAVAWEIPVAPMYALEDGDASAFLATTGGLWRWRDATGPEPVWPGSALVALHRQESEVRAYQRPTVRADGSRIAIDRAFDWTEGAAVWVEHPIAAGEACFVRSVQGPWTADTRIDDSAVCITHASGATLWLACSGPGSAVWAGRSLVVTLLSGGVLLFRNLLAVVEPIAPRP